MYTVGPATAFAITHLHFSTIIGADTGNGGALADLIVRTFSRDDSLTINRPRVFVEESDRPPSLPLLFLVGDKRRDIIPKRLAAKGIPLEELVVYETAVASTFDKELDEVLNDTNDGEVEWIVFFSPSGAEIALSKLRKMPQRVKIATIGPTTEEYLRKEWDIVPDMVPAKPEPISMVQGILERVKS